MINQSSIILHAACTAPAPAPRTIHPYQPGRQADSRAGGINFTLFSACAVVSSQPGRQPYCADESLLPVI